MKKKKKKPSFGNISEEFKDEIIKTNNIDGNTIQDNDPQHDIFDGD